MTKKEKVVSFPAYVTTSQKKALDKLSETTRIRRAELVRMAVDDLLRKHKRKGGAT